MATQADLFRTPARSPSVTSDSNAGLPSRSDIDGWSAVIDELSTAADAFGREAEAIEITADAHMQQLLRPGGTDWEGDAASAAQEQGYSDRGVVYAAADLMRRMRKVAAAGAGSIRQCRDLTLDAISEAERDDFRVSEDLTVTDTRQYTAQQTAMYASRMATADAHHGYICMRAQNLVSEDSRIGAELTSAAADLGIMVPAEWVGDEATIREASNGDGDIQAYDNDTNGEDPLSAEQIAERLRNLRRGLNGGIREVDSEEEIFDLYEELARGGSPLPVPDNYYDRRVLPDGTIIGVRESNNHGPTLDVSYPPGVTGPDKVHLPPAPIAPPPTPPTPGEAPVIASPPNLPVIDHPPAPGLIPPWAQSPTGIPHSPIPPGEVPPGIGVAPPALPTAPPVGSGPDWLPSPNLPSPTPEEQVGIGGVLFGGLLAFLGWLGTPKVSY
ncbi:hypothetical protein [Mycolicibacterium neoaurum]|uniref:Transmembrane protein n=1 Tax=Mycolicibacterium neoaurum TaxID=1795 RepID=A0AAV2WFN8_MYCNE|nr:hypothetical protein [Mycolicibacterium neoaurum]CDQ42751.1 transmembrane protein [Mycolicibacterium neoaurum]